MFMHAIVGEASTGRPRQDLCRRAGLLLDGAPALPAALRGREQARLRLAANIPFIRHNLCPMSFIDVPQQAYVDAMLGVYELNWVELLRDVFVWACERSCQQPVAVKQALVPPDLFRLRHRQALAEVIAAVVRADDGATEHAVRSRMPAQVPAAEGHQFVKLVLAEFDALHPGNAVRFGLRPLEAANWQGAHRRGDSARWREITMRISRPLMGVGNPRQPAAVLNGAHRTGGRRCGTSYRARSALGNGERQAVTTVVAHAPGSSPSRLRLSAPAGQLRSLRGGRIAT